MAGVYGEVTISTKFTLQYKIANTLHKRFAHTRILSLNCYNIIK